MSLNTAASRTAGIAASKLHSVMVMAVYLTLSFATPVTKATAIDLATGGPIKAQTNLVIDGINLGLNAANAGAGVVLNRPWVFMFADGTPAPQVFRSSVAAPGGIAANSAVSSGFLGRGSSAATANGATGVLFAAAATRGIASANALAGIGTTGISALPFATALRAHIVTILVDPLAAPDTPVAQPAPPDPDGFSAFDPAFIPASAILDAFLVNELDETFPLFHLEARLGFNGSTGRFDDLLLEVTGPGGSPSSLITESMFSFFDGPDGFGYRLDDIDLDIPYALPSGWENLTFTAALEARGEAASSAIALPPVLVLVITGLLALTLGSPLPFAKPTVVGSRVLRRVRHATIVRRFECALMNAALAARDPRPNAGADAQEAA